MRAHASPASILLRLFDELLLLAALIIGAPFRIALRRIQEKLRTGHRVQSPPAEVPPIILFFNSSGLFLPYYIGVAEYLKEHYDVDADHVYACGVSGGYAPAASIVLGLDPEVHWEAIENLRRRGEQRWPFGTFLLSEHDMIHHGYLPILRPRQEELLPKCLSGRLQLGSTAVFPCWTPMLGAIWTSRYGSMEALCHACTCSMRTLPILRWFGTLNGTLCFDGWMGCTPQQVMDAIPGADASRLLVVSAVPCPEAHIAPRQVLGGLSKVVTLPSRGEFDDMVHRGREDAKRAVGTIEATGLLRLSKFSKSEN